MYMKPALQRFGTFREITQAGVEFGYGDLGGGYWRPDSYVPPPENEFEPTSS